MEKIAIIGLSCLFPDAKNPDEFWQNIIERKDSTSSATIEEIGVEPTNFYDATKGSLDKTYSLKGGYIRNFKFESTGYNLSPEIIEGLDPIFKGTLYVAKQALEHSHYLGNAKVLSRCGVILGNLSFPTKFSQQLFTPIYRQAIEPAVQELLQDVNFQLASSQTSNQVPVYNGLLSGLSSAIVAQALSLSSVNFTLDAACSSSLYGVKLASHYLLSHKADLMLAGAISYADPLFIRMLFSGLQAYPENGVSCPFDKLSRGLTPADGMGMVVLKRYSDAIRDGDQIHAIICGNGLSNDGKGRHLLSPNPQGQLLAFKRAYEEAGISPKNIDYLECHATGTPLGDTTEINTTDAFFSQHQASPLVGSVKSNVGHLLTAAGMVGMIKVILSMSKGVIPPTINLTESISSPNNIIADERIVTSATPWPTNNGSLKHAAISAFGFGGNNAHLILQQHSNMEPTTDSNPVMFEASPYTKIAIVGMDALFGSCDGLDAFDRSIYEGTQHFIPLPPRRWKGIEEQKELLKRYGFDDGEAPEGAYIKEFEIDTLHSKIPPNEVETINPQQLLILKVADRALRDAGLSKGENVAVIVAMETELSVHQLQQRWDLSWQVKEGLTQGNNSLPTEQVSELETLVKDSIHKPAQTSEYLGYIGNIMTSRISALWNFTGPSFTVSAGENSAFKALEVAQMLLATGEAEAVVVGAVDLAGGVENVLLRNQLARINTGVNTLGYDQKANGWTAGEGAGAVVLKRLDIAKQEQDRIYAVIDAISLVQECTPPKEVNNFPQPPLAETVTQACQKAFAQAGVQPADIGYVEVFGSGIAREDKAEIAGLIQAYQTPEPELSCAIGSVKANIGHTFAASGIASLIKTALCLHHRYLPVTPQWSGPKNPEVWQGSPFYVTTESRAWFFNAELPKRVAAINGLGLDGTCAHLILSEEPSHRDSSSRYLEHAPFYLFPIAAGDRSALLERLEELQKTIENCSSLSAAASQNFTFFQKCQNCKEVTYTLSILGHNKDELKQELQRALKGVAIAFDTGKDWQTPVGSYFTAKPLGKRGTISFVYPGLFNSYIGVGRSILRLFPSIWELVRNVITDLGSFFGEKRVFPRSLSLLSRRQLETLEQQLLNDSDAMLGSGVCVSVGLTAIMQDYFQVRPQSTFGYSLGELSMLCAQSVWANYDQGISSFNSSPIFSTRLSGPKNAVREHWGLPQLQDGEKTDFWSTYILMTPVTQVIECLKHENRVYLTHVNTPKEVVIAGDSRACQKVIQNLNCDAFPVPFDYVLHCEAMSSEYHELAKLNTLPILNVPETIIYSAAEYQPITIDSHSIADNVAKGLCHQLDFSRLINRVYEDGARIFVEAGPGSTCSRWIGENLKNKEHLTVFLNQRGVDDHTAIVKALAKLASHQVSLDLSPLYCQTQDSSSQSKSVLKTITLGGNRISSTILSYKDKKIFFKENSSDPLTPKAAQQQQITPSLGVNELTFSQEISSDILTPETVNKQQITPKLEITEIVTSPKEISLDPPTLKAAQQQQENSNSKTSEIVSSPMIQGSISLSENGTKSIVNNSSSRAQEISYEEQTNSTQVLNSDLKTYKFAHELGLPAPNNSHYQHLNTNNSLIAKAHADFLQARRESLQQISEIIQLQVALSQQMLESESLEEQK